MNYTLDKQKLNELLKQWQQQFTLLTPSKINGSSSFAPWDGSDFTGWYRNTITPAKNCFLPDVEALFSFTKKDGSYHLEAEAVPEEKRLIFGIRPCDSRALTILDNVYLGEKPEDSYYKKRRANTTLVGLSCNEPYDSCFCTSLGSGPDDTRNLDVMVIDIGDKYLFQPITGKGEELLSKTEGLAKATKANLAAGQKVIKAIKEKITRKVSIDNIKKRLLDIFEDKDYWQDVAAKCISCGICTLLCPTCYCFDINDDTTGEKKVRCRNLDSCSFSTYTKMPMENPRAEKWRRVRNKLCHKYEFYPIAYDIIACTGCGRCIRLCPVNWDITRIINSLPLEKKAIGETA